MAVDDINLFYTDNNINTLKLAILDPPILLLSCVNDLPSVWKILDRVMFVNGTNFFYSDDDINTFLKKVNEWVFFF